MRQEKLAKVNSFQHMSSVQGAPGWLGYIRDEILPRYIGIIYDYFISHCKDPYQPTSIMECQQGFERCSHGA